MTPAKFKKMKAKLEEEFPRVQETPNTYMPEILTKDKSYRPVGKITLNSDGTLTFDIYEFDVNEKIVETHTSPKLNILWFNIVPYFEDYARKVLKPPSEQFS